MNSFGMQLPICLIWTSSSLRKLSRFLLCQGTCLFKHIELPSMPVFTKQEALLRGLGGAFHRGKNYRKKAASLSIGDHSTPSQPQNRTKSKVALILLCQKKYQGSSNPVAASELRLHVYRSDSGRVRKRKKTFYLDQVFRLFLLQRGLTTKIYMSKPWLLKRSLTSPTSEEPKIHSYTYDV